jgi:hypothetical protein
MSKIFKAGLLAGLAVASGFVAAHAGLSNWPPHPMSLCAPGFGVTGQSGGPNGFQEFTCVAHVTCPKGSAQQNFAAISPLAPAKTGQMSATLSYRCSYNAIK